MELKNVDIAMLLLLVPVLLTVYFGIIKPSLDDKSNDDEK
jgi:hypothetical protein